MVVFPSLATDVQKIERLRWEIFAHREATFKFQQLLGHFLTFLPSTHCQQKNIDASITFLAVEIFGPSITRAPADGIVPRNDLLIEKFENAIGDFLVDVTSRLIAVLLLCCLLRHTALPVRAGKLCY